jgi:ABC-type nitrate/sulfonate/bicarbonate transport system substrate-binding protein
MRIRNKAVVASIAAILAAGLAACSSSGGDGTPAPAPTGDANQPATQDATQDSTGDATDQPTDAAPVTASIAVSHAAGATPGDMPFYTARARLEDQGWQIRDLTFDDPADVLAAVSSGEAAFGYAGTAGIIAMLQAVPDAPVRLVFQQRPEEFVIVGGEGITQCSDLEGQPFGVVGPGVPGTVLAFKWIEQNCGANVTEVDIADGSVRVVSLVNGDLSGTLLQLSDVLSQSPADQEKLTVMGTFAESFPGLLGLPMVVNTDWLAENPEAAAQFIATVLQVNAEANADVSVLDAAVSEFLPPEQQANFPTTWQAYQDNFGGFPTDGGFTVESVQTLLDTAAEVGLMEGTPLTVEQFFDPAPLAAALALIG